MKNGIFFVTSDIEHVVDTLPRVLSHQTHGPYFRRVITKNIVYNNY
jgi:hypothetical protein